jgi:hypothetical protein
MLPSGLRDLFLLHLEQVGGPCVVAVISGGPWAIRKKRVAQTLGNRLNGQHRCPLEALI